MAKVQCAGAVISAQPLRQLDNGDWLMQAQGHGPRFQHGAEIRVTPSEIIEMAAAEMPPATQGPIIMSDKLSRLATLAQETHKFVDAEADRGIDRLTKSKDKVSQGLSKIHGLADGYDKGAAALDDFANQMSNFPPLDDK